MNSAEQQQYETLPPDNTPVWRYISLAKLLALLRTKSVFFCRADQFDDVFEGAFTEGSLRELAEQWGGEYPESVIQLCSWLPSRSFVSCWHAANVESAALWKIYAGVEGSLAIQSTVGALKKAFPSILEKKGDDLIVSQDVRRVQYIDYLTEHSFINDLAGPLCYKRQAFSFEQEIRVIRQELPSISKPSPERPNGRAINLATPPAEVGREIEVNLDELIEKVYLAPSSPAWLLPTVRSAMERFGFTTIECRQSSLDELPAFGRLSSSLGM